MKPPHFCGISIFSIFSAFWGFSTCVFFGDLGIRFFSILPDPACPGDPMVGPHTDCVASWDTVGGIQALGGPQGRPQTGFGVAQVGPVAVLAVLEGQFGWKTVNFLQVGFCRTQGALGTPR